MKRIVIIIVFLLCSQAFLGQDIFKKFENRNQVSTEIIDKKMFDLMNKVKIDASDTETKKYQDLIKKLDYLKISRTYDVTVSNEMKLEFDKLLKSSGLIEIKKATEGNSTVRVIVDNENEIKNAYLLIQIGNTTKESILMYARGIISKTELSTLSNKITYSRKNN
jgi:hypothetical protein